MNLKYLKESDATCFFSEFGAKLGRETTFDSSVWLDFKTTKKDLT